MTKAVLIHEDEGCLNDIEIDIDPIKNEIFKNLGGPVTFIGQWPDLDVVIIKCITAQTKNMNTIPHPFQSEVIFGKVLLIRMDKYSEPRDFTLDEYTHFKKMSLE